MNDLIGDFDHNQLHEICARAAGTAYTVRALKRLLGRPYMTNDVATELYEEIAELEQDRDDLLDQLKEIEAFVAHSIEFVERHE